MPVDPTVLFFQRVGPFFVSIAYLALTGIVLLKMVFSVQATDMKEFSRRFGALWIGISGCFLVAMREKMLIELAEFFGNCGWFALFIPCLLLGIALVGFLDWVRRKADIKDMGTRVFILLVTITAGLQIIFYFRFDPLREIFSTISFGIGLGGLSYYVFFFKKEA